MVMYGLTRATFTLIGVAAAGLLIWLATQVFGENDLDRQGRFWAACGLLAAAGLTMALSQLLGGWTKWGWPRISGSVFLLGFLPTLVAGGFVLATRAPGSAWLPRHARSWSGDLGIRSLVDDLGGLFPAIAFGIGLVLGFTFDTSGPRAAAEERGPAIAAPPRERPVTAQPEPETVVTRTADTADAPPPPEPSPRSGEPN